MTERIDLGTFRDSGVTYDAWLELKANSRPGPLLCWREHGSTNDAQLVSLAQLLTVQVDANEARGTEKQRIVRAAVGQLATSHRGFFEIRWVPDDGIPF